jgi:hypothetical protein
MARIFLLALLWSAAATAQTETVSPSSLRYDLDYPTIAYSATPRANEIARLQSRLNRGEVRLTMDSERGAVFYSLPNQRGAEPVMQRETNRCLSCHDTFSMTGGGVPRFLFLSAPVDAEGLLLPREISIDTDDRTPLARRWGGWYVTGQVGHAHRGNADLQLDTHPYLSDHSDVVALLVLTAD